MDLTEIKARLQPDEHGWNFYDDHPHRGGLDLGRVMEHVEDQAKQIERLESALRGAGVASELVEHIKVGD